VARLPAALPGSSVRWGVGIGVRGDEGVVVALLAGEGGGVAGVVRGVGRVDGAQRGRDGLDAGDGAERFEGEEGGTAAGGLGHAGHDDGAAEGVGHDLGPGGGADEAAARGDELLGAGHDGIEDAGEQGEAERDGLHARAQDVGRARGEGEAEDGAAREGRPARAALAREERQDRQAVGVGGQSRDLGIEGGVGVEAQGFEQPGEEAARVVERAAEHHAVGVDAVAPGAPGDAQVGRAPGGAQGAGGADHEGEAILGHAAAADVAARAIAVERVPGDVRERWPAGGVLGAQAGEGRVGSGREAAWVQGHRGEQLGVPGAGVLVEQPGAGGHREAAARLPEQAQVQVLAEGEPAVDAGDQVGLGLGEPAQLGGPVAPVEDAAGAGVDGALVQLGAQGASGGVAAGVSPEQDGGEGAAGGIHAEQAVPEAAGADGADGGQRVGRLGGDGVDEAGGTGEEGLGVELGAAVGGGVERDGALNAGALDGAAARVVDEGAGGRGADVERQHQRRLGSR
jgi:hypothetical protein